MLNRRRLRCRRTYEVFSSRPLVPIQGSSRVSDVNVWIRDDFVDGLASSRTLCRRQLRITSKTFRDLRYRSVGREMIDASLNVFVCQIVLPPWADCLRYVSEGSHMSVSSATTNADLGSTTLRPFSVRCECCIISIQRKCGESK